MIVLGLCRRSKRQNDQNSDDTIDFHFYALAPGPRNVLACVADIFQTAIVPFTYQVLSAKPFGGV